MHQEQQSQHYHYNIHGQQIRQTQHHHVLCQQQPHIRQHLQQHLVQYDQQNRHLSPTYLQQRVPKLVYAGAGNQFTPLDNVPLKSISASAENPDKSSPSSVGSANIDRHDVTSPVPDGRLPAISALSVHLESDRSCQSTNVIAPISNAATSQTSHLAMQNITNLLGHGTAALDVPSRRVESYTLQAATGAIPRLLVTSPGHSYPEAGRGVDIPLLGAETRLAGVASDYKPTNMPANTVNGEPYVLTKIYSDNALQKYPTVHPSSTGHPHYDYQAAADTAPVISHISDVSCHYDSSEAMLPMLTVLGNISNVDLVDTSAGTDCKTAAVSDESSDSSSDSSTDSSATPAATVTAQGKISFLD